MKSKRLSSLAVLMFCSVVFLRAAVVMPFSVKGQLVDSATAKAIPYATVRVAYRSTPKEAVSLGVTDDAGCFSVGLPADSDYIVQLSYVSKGDVVRTFSTSARKVTDLGQLLMSESAHLISGVEVVAQRPLVKSEIDRTSYSVQDDPAVHTDDLFDMLRKVPLVTIDGQENVKVNGTSKFKVLLNGKENSMMNRELKDVLRSIPAENIQRIEVITSPSPKYQTEGYTTVLNIVTVAHRNMQGYNASLHANTNQYGSNNESVYTTVQKGKFTASVNGSVQMRRNEPATRSTSLIENFMSDNLRYTNTTSGARRHSHMGFYMGGLDASYEPDTLNLFSLSGGYMKFRSSNWNTQNSLVSNAAQAGVYGYHNNSDGRSDFHNLSAQFDYQHSFRHNKDEMLTFSYSYEDWSDNSHSADYYDQFIRPDSLRRYVGTLYDQKYFTSGNSKEHTAQADYTTLWNKHHTFSAGAKFIHRDKNSDGTGERRINDYYTNTLGPWLSTDTIDNRFQNLEEVLNAYTEYRYRYKELQLRASLSYEHTYSSLKYKGQPDRDYHRSFNNFIPALGAAFRLTDTQKMDVSYRYSVYRPNIYYLNPYVEVYPTSRSYGNPDLKSETNHNVDVRYELVKQKFYGSISGSYTYTGNSIESYSWMDAKGINTSTYRNIGHVNGLSFNANSNFALWKNSRFNINAATMYTDYSSPNLQVSSNGWTYYGNLNVQQTLPWRIRLAGEFGANSGYRFMQTKMKGTLDYSFSISRAFLKEDALNIQLRASNPFNAYRTNTTETTAATYYSKMVSRRPLHTFSLSVSYRLGKLQAAVKKTARSIENNDVKSGGGATN